jgi:hypothetical protein
MCDSLRDFVCVWQINSGTNMSVFLPVRQHLIQPDFNKTRQTMVDVHKTLSNFGPHEHFVVLLRLLIDII